MTRPSVPSGSPDAEDSPKRTHRQWGPIPPVVALIGLIGMMGLHAVWPGATLSAWPWTLAGLPVGLCGLAFAGMAQARFRREGAAVRPFDPTPVLVTGGPFRVSRNPMYLGLVVALSGVAIGLGTLTPWLGPVAVALWLDIAFARREERFRAARFGAAYAAYRQRVRRWI